jgi:ABC-2 type transport system permease protein
MRSPIADLSYRNYDGPLESPTHRWWAIARMSLRQTVKKKSVWVFTALSGWYFIGMIFVLFIIDQSGAFAPPGAPNPSEAFFSRIVWKDQFLHGFNFAQIPALIVVLITGAGAIANDNRANALLIYLSRPCTKLDYVLGKWFSIFLTIFTVYFLPAFVFFLYGALSYRERGFLSADPWLFPKMVVLYAVSAAFLSSLVMGISSMFHQGRMAGATYAGLFFLSNFFTQLMTIGWASMNGNRHNEPSPTAVESVKNLFYASVDGLDHGLAKAILGTDGSAYFGLPSRFPMVPAPNLFLVVGVAILISLLSLWLAWSRVRAVEVVG